jgi:hypothetical protein
MHTHKAKVTFCFKDDQDLVSFSKNWQMPRVKLHTKILFGTFVWVEIFFVHSRIIEKVDIRNRQHFPFNIIKVCQPSWPWNFKMSQRNFHRTRLLTGPFPNWLNEIYILKFFQSRSSWRTTIYLTRWYGLCFNNSKWDSTLWGLKCFEAANFNTWHLQKRFKVF